MEFKKDYGFLTEDLRKVEFLQQAVTDFINSGVPDIDPFDPTPAEREVLIDYFHHYYAMLEFQSILYARLKLMNDPDLVGIIDAIIVVCDVLGRDLGETITDFHTNMKQECKDALSELTGEDMDSYEGIDIDFSW